MYCSDCGQYIECFEEYCEVCGAVICCACHDYHICYVEAVRTLDEETK